MSERSYCVPRRLPICLLLITMSFACSGANESPFPDGGSTVDAGEADATVVSDTGVDGGPADQGTHNDVGSNDVGSNDVGLDAGSVDTGPAVCGDGIKQAAELCDWAVEWDVCPTGWGTCTRCARDCQTPEYAPALPCSHDNFVFEHNSRGHRTLERRLDAKGQIEFERAQEYDARWNLVRVLTEFAGIRAEQRLEYDAQDRLTQRWYDEGRDGVPDSITDISYDGMGGVVEENDRDGDGTVDNTRRVNYDALGRIVLEERDDDPTDAAINSRRVYTWRPDGQPERREVDSDGDGTLDSTQMYFYNGANQEIRLDEDLDADGAVDRQVLTEYNPLGQRVITTTYDGVATPNGSYLARTTYIWDQNGDQIRTEDDLDGDGTIDIVTHITWDTLHRPILNELDIDNDGSVEATFGWAYDALGNQTMTSVVDQSQNEVRNWSFNTTTNLPIASELIEDGMQTFNHNHDCNEALYLSLPFARLR